MQTPSALRPSLSRLWFLALLLAACSGASSTELFERSAGGAAPSASPSASPTDTPSPDMADDDAAAQTPDGGKKDATSPTPPAQPKNPMAGAGAVTKVAVGYGSLEGPVWRSASSSLFFSDLDGNSIERFAPPATFSTYRFPSGGSNGLAVDAQGQLVVCEGKPLYTYGLDTGNHLVSYIKESRANPSAPREYRVIDCRGNTLSAGRCDDDHISIKPSFANARNLASGRYERIPG